jgi:hypothetical protein
MSIMAGFTLIENEILQSTLAENWKARHVFEDLLKLAWPDGIVDIPAKSIAHTTRMPLEVVVEALRYLESPDPESRSPSHEGRRIVLLDPKRPWGWRIVNWDEYRNRSVRRVANIGEAARKAESRKQKNTDKPHTTTSQEATADRGPEPSTGFKYTLSMAMDWFKGMCSRGENQDGYSQQEVKDAWTYYEGNGWMVGRNPVADHRMAIVDRINDIRRWANERKDSRGNNSGYPAAAAAKPVPGSVAKGGF